jgi:hypothetical protein
MNAQNQGRNGRDNYNTKKCRGLDYLLVGMFWPFLVSAVFAFMNVHRTLLVDLTDYSFHLLFWPTVTLGLIPIPYGLFLLLPKNWSFRLRWILSIVIALVLTLLLYLVIYPSFIFFYFAFGGNC